MKTGNKTEVKKKEKKLPPKEKSSRREVKDSKVIRKVDTDFHHEHPFREQ